jgi:ribosomal protein RSM22 (predicted rRNA methylase)
VSQSAAREDRLRALVAECASRGPRRPGQDIASLSAGFGENRSSRRADYMNDPAARGAYLAFFVPQYAAKIAAVLERSAREAHLVLPAAPRVLDVGAGPLSGTLGAWLACGALGPSVAVDLSGRALESGRDILRSLAPAADVRLVEAPVQRRPLPPGPFDLVIVAHVLNELGDPRRGLDLRAELVRDLTSTLAPGGRVLVVEPGTRVHGRALMALRDRLVADGLTLHAPCVGAKKCPLLQTRRGAVARARCVRPARARGGPHKDRAQAQLSPRVARAGAPSRGPTRRRRHAARTGHRAAVWLRTTWARDACAR